MSLSIIAALSKNGIIGKNGKIPWNIPADMKHFKQVTMGHPILMGRKTFESIGKPLPGRRNIILTRNKDYHHPACETATSIEEAIKMVLPGEELFICGGKEAYREALPIAETLYITKIEVDVDEGISFPEIPANSFKKVSEKVISDNPKAVVTVLKRIMPY
ncbi:MAG: dihydrofolate reductase [Desulfuromonadales bacterium]|nr:dihydrofolate reductase [Desulfuromonadales bacterium]